MNYTYTRTQELKAYCEEHDLLPTFTARDVREFMAGTAVAGLAIRGYILKHGKTRAYGHTVQTYAFKPKKERRRVVQP